MTPHVALLIVLKYKIIAKVFDLSASGQQCRLQKDRKIEQEPHA